MEEKVDNGKEVVEEVSEVDPSCRGTLTALWLFSAEQQSVVAPQHHLSDVFVPSHGVSCTISSAFSNALVGGIKNHTHPLWFLT
jgi:hypothetical protein